MRQLPAAAALTFSPTGDLAVGLHQGGTLVLDAASLHERVLLPAYTGRGQAPSRALAFSPDGTMLAVGTDAGTIEIYAVGGGWDRLGSCQGGHTAPVVAIDWSEDGTELQTNSLHHEVVFWKASSATQISASATRGARASANCMVWSLGCDGCRPMPTR